MGSNFQQEKRTSPMVGADLFADWTGVNFALFGYF